MEKGFCRYRHDKVVKDAHLKYVQDINNGTYRKERIENMIKEKCEN